LRNSFLSAAIWSQLKIKGTKSANDFCSLKPSKGCLVTEYLKRWVPHARAVGPFQATILRILLRAAYPVIIQETQSWPVQDLPVEVQSILAQHRSRRQTTSLPWIRLAQLRRSRPS
jgi:hypothetical protein